MSTIEPVIRTFNEQDAKWMRLAYEVAAIESQDTQTQVGAVVVKYRRKKTLYHMTGANRLPQNVPVSPEKFERPAKYKWLGHAEETCILNALTDQANLFGTTLFCNWACCSTCARLIIHARIGRVVTHKQCCDRMDETWAEDIAVARQMLSEAGVAYELVDGTIGDGLTNLFRGEVWYP